MTDRINEIRNLYKAHAYLPHLSSFDNFSEGYELAWQARGERIKELEAKLDKAREALSSCFGGDDYYNRPIIKKALKELGK